MSCKIRLLYGEDEYTKNKTIEKFSQEVLGSNVSDLNYETYYSDEIDLTNILEKAYIEPFFGGNRLITIKFLSIKYFQDLNSNSKKALLIYIKSPSRNSSLVLLIYGKLERKTNGFFNELSKLTQDIKSIEFTEFKLPREDAIYSFIKDKCKKSGKSIRDDAIDSLLERTGPDLLNLNNELDKLFLYIKDKNIIMQTDVENVVVDSKTRNIFELVNFIGSKKVSEALLILNNIIKKEEDMPMILNSIVKHFKRIWISKSLVSKGKREPEIARVLGTKEYFVHNLLKEINNFSFDNLPKIFEKLLNADLNIKTSVLPSRIILESLFIDLCS